MEVYMIQIKSLAATKILLVFFCSVHYIYIYIKQQMLIPYSQNTPIQPKIKQNRITYYFITHYVNIYILHQVC